jgi:RNA polymerase sigma factor (sigma-70 family)
LDLHLRVRGLKDAMAGLTARQNAMVQAFYGHDHSVKQIAGDLGCAEGTVKATLFQSLAKLRKILEVKHEPRV